MTLAEEVRQLLARLQVLDELLDADPDGRAGAQGKRAPAVPRDHLGAAREEIQVHEVCQDLRAAGDVGAEIAPAPEGREPAAPPGKEAVGQPGEARVGLHAELVEEEARDRHVRE